MQQKLPIYNVIAEIKDLLGKNSRLVLQAPPGAGKTTCVPLELQHEEWMGNKKIIMLEPRRIAARNAAYWMARTIDGKVGEKIGYAVHLDKKVSSRTVVEVVTEGVFINRLLNDPELSDTALVIFDEFHERSLDADLALALVKESQEVLRDDLKILIMSATLDTDYISKFLGNCPIVTSEGRSYPVEINYSPPLENGLVTTVVSAVLNALDSDDGSLLVFLPGVGEIKRVQSVLKDKVQKHVLITPLYGALSRDEQERAIEPAIDGIRKVVLATSIAESSITIKGVKVVIDSGLIRRPIFNPKTGMDTLETMALSKASADQRTGRAGRIEPGVCYRLWESHKKLDDYTDPGILCEDLSSLTLTLERWGCRDIDQLQWVSKPNRSVYDHSKSLLKELGAIDGNGITDRGIQLSKMPLHPRLGSIVLQGEKISMKSLACDIAAILSERDFLTFDRDNYQSDLNCRIEALKGKSIFGAKINNSAIKRIKELSKSLFPGSRIKNTAIAGSLLIAAYPDRIAKKISEGLFQLVNGSEAILAEVDTLYHEKYIIIPSMGGTGRIAKVFLAVPVSEDEIMDVCKNSLKKIETLDFDRDKKRFKARKEIKLGHITLKEERISNISKEDFQSALCNYLGVNGLSDLNWTKDTVKFRDRVNFLHGVNIKYPDFSDKSLSRDFSWLTPFLGGLTIKNPIRDIPLLEALKSFFTWDILKDIDEMAPTHFAVPSGSNVPIEYSTGEPVLKVRIQELFGLIQTPSICNGARPITIHLLSPASRPIQITKDLKSFWDNTYKEVKKDLKGRYPKHYWPEDPYQAQATNRVKRKMVK